MADIGLIQLIAIGKINENYPFNCAEHLSEEPTKKIAPNVIKITHYFDGVREIFLIIDLPPLPDNMCWKDNILSFLIEKIQIHFEYFNTTLTLSNDYIKKIISDNIEKFPNKLLFSNLSVDKRKSMSRKQIQLTLPLKISNFINNPAELCVHYGTTIKIFLFNDHLVEENDNFMVDNIDWNIKVFGVFYTPEVRNEIFQNMENIFSKQNKNNI